MQDCAQPMSTAVVILLYVDAVQQKQQAKKQEGLQRRSAGLIYEPFTHSWAGENDTGKQ